MVKTLTGRAEESQQLLVAARDVRIAMLECRRREKDFLMRDPTNPEFFETGDSHFLAKHRAALASLGEQIAALEALGDDSMTPRIKNLRGCVERYATSFDALVAALRERGLENFGKAGQVQRATADLQSALDKMRRDDLLAMLLDIERIEGQSLFRSQPDSTEQAHRIVERLIADAPAELAPPLARFRQSVEEYNAHIERIGRTEDTGLRGEMRTAVHEIAPVLDQLSNHVSVFAELKDRRLQATYLAFGMALSALASGVFYWLARMIAAPIVRAADLALEIAETGDLRQKLPVVYKDETGRLSESFNRMISSLRETKVEVTRYVREIEQRRLAESEVEHVQKQLIEAARQAGKAEIATSVLHNVGNVLNSVNVSAGIAQDRMKQLGVEKLNRAVRLLESHLGDVAAYVSEDERGKHLPRFLIELSRNMEDAERELADELNSLTKHIDHIKTIVATQQSYAKESYGVVEVVRLADVIEDAIHINSASMQRHSVKISRKLDEVQPMLVDKQKLLQIMINLISNAKNACQGKSPAEGRIEILMKITEGDRVSIQVADNGVGIARENLTRIFAHGFTTRKEGHGFGLHSAALAAAELGGSLSAQSDGPGRGATFTLQLPYIPEETSAAGGPSVAAIQMDPCPQAEGQPASP